MVDSKDMKALTKIKQAKELLDIGAITEEEFNQIKDKYFKQLKSNKKPKTSTKTNIYESSTSQAKNDVAREVTKGIIKGLFGQMDNSSYIDDKPSENHSSTSNTNFRDILGAVNQQSNNTVVKMKSRQNELNQENLKLCPGRHKKIPHNANQCSLCKTKLNNRNQSLKKKEKVNNKHDFKICPNCCKQIPKNAIRCKYCKTMLKYYSNVNSSNNVSSIIDKVDQRNKKTGVDDNPSDAQLLDDDFKKKIEENIDDICRIFSIPNLGKKFVINKLTNDFTQEEISNKLNKYLNNSQKESSISKRIAHKRKLMENNIKPIPEEHFKLYFIIHDSSFKSKNKFINHIQTYWGINEINRFYEEYASLLKNGIQKEHFEKIMEYNIKDTCEIFSMHYSMRRLGNRFVINKILNNRTENEIKEKLNSHFKLSIDYLNNIDTNNYEPEEEKVTISSKPDYYTYKVQVNSLKSKFIKKEQNVRELVEKCFPAPQMTNTKFISMVDECSKIFNQNVESAMLIIESTNKYSDKLENQLKSEIEILKELNIKLDLLRDELLIVHSENDNPDADMLFNEMDSLIESVKNYKNI